jgi:predicted regulator of Ras-like GTPase activity (Roadblock/LC7/MglB family)
MISETLDPQSSFSNLSLVIISIRKELEYLAKFADIHAVILFRLDGQVLSSYYCNEKSEDLLVVISWVKNIISKTMEELQRGSKSVKYDKEIRPQFTVPVFFYRAGYSSILVTLLDSKANSGLMEIEMSRTAKRLGQIIDYKKPLGV